MVSELQFLYPQQTMVLFRLIAMMHWELFLLYLKCSYGTTHDSVSTSRISMNNQCTIQYVSIFWSGKLDRRFFFPKDNSSISRFKTTQISNVFSSCILSLKKNIWWNPASSKMYHIILDRDQNDHQRLNIRFPVHQIGEHEIRVIHRLSHWFYRKPLL